MCSEGLMNGDYKMSISVVIPCYNAEKYLGDTVSSVLSQTRLPNEIVFVNDGSTDNTKYMLEAYASLEIISEEKIKVSIYENDENRGIGYTRQKGIDVSDGKYIAFLSSDDVWDKRFLEKSLSVLKDFSGNRFCTYVDYYKCNKKLEPYTIFRCPDYTRADVIDWALNKNMFINFSGIVFSKMLPIMFEPELRRGEDLMFLLDSILIDCEWCRIDEPLLYYRVMGGKFDLDRFLLLWKHNKERLIKLGVDQRLIENRFNESYDKVTQGRFERLLKRICAL